MVGGKPFVISTSYNGRGPVHYKLGRKGRYRRVNVFCNPRYRGLGPKPNANTQIAGVDAFLYLNRPGVSGAGTCNGGFKAGEWWPERALMYSRYATEWYGPPKGTRYGFPQRISLCALGAPVKGEQGYSPVSPEKRCGREQHRQRGSAACKRGGAGPFWPDASSRLRAGRGPRPAAPPRPPPRPSAPIRCKVPDLFRAVRRRHERRAPTRRADPRGVNPGSPNPLAGDSFFVDPSEQSVKDLHAYQRAGQHGRRRRHRQARPPAQGPLAGPPTPGRNMPLKVRNYLNCVQVFQPGATPLFMVLRHQGKQCNAALRRRGGGRGRAPPRPGTATWPRRSATSAWSSPSSRTRIGTIECLARSRRQAAQGSAALRRRRSIQASQRHDLPGGHRLGLEERALHRVACCATSASARCAASCST